MAKKKAKKKAGSSKFVLRIDLRFVENKLDHEEWSDEEYSKMALEMIDDFINELKDKLEGGISDRILISNSKEFFIDDLKKGAKKIKIFDSFIDLYFLVTKAITAEELDGLFIKMDDYGFYSSYPNDNGEIIVQGYDYGEYDTGYFASTIGGWDSDPESYIATENMNYLILFSHNIALGHSLTLLSCFN